MEKPTTSFKTKSLFCASSLKLPKEKSYVSILEAFIGNPYLIIHFVQSMNPFT
ncbi:hypothetical protein ACFWGC_06580 [Cytobacillus pseudoceanisediminis]|uniref:hypothetical protein n=1 Tax=Cytobacillus TaxID=2675230 RepID=UPI0002FF9F10|nr:hypothetical protein [Cytobacillus sp. Bac17]